MAEMEIDVRGQTCPVPLVQCRKAIKKASPGDLVIVKGTHPASKKEIPMACEAMGLKVLEIKKIKKRKEWEIKSSEIKPEGEWKWGKRQSLSCTVAIWIKYTAHL